MELIQIKGNTWYLDGLEMIPLYRMDEHRCILLDSGWAWEREELREAFEREGLIPVGVIGSHAHLDHMGNHKWLQETYGTCICMSSGEAAIAASPVMCKSLYNTLSLNAIMDVVGGELLFRTDRVLGAEDGAMDFLGVPFRVHHTPGHSADHVCIGTPDGVCYLGDLLLSEKVILTAKMPYHQVQSMARESMMKMRDVTGYSDYILAHKAVIRDLPAAVELNLSRMDWVAERFMEVMETPATWDRIMEEVMRRNRLKPSNVIKMASYENAVRSYLDALRDAGKITVYYEGGTRYFARIQ